MEKYVKVLNVLIFLMTIGFVSVSDIKDFKIKNQIILLLLLYSFIQLLCGFLNPLNYIYATIISVIFLVLYNKTKGIGMGDIKLIFTMTVFVGLEKSLIGLCYSFLLAGSYAAILMMFKKLALKSKMPLGPFIMIGYLLSFVIK